jgi:tyrosine-protein kinase Etk/Wzc
MTEDDREVRETGYGSTQAVCRQPDDDEISLLDLALVLVKRKKLIFWMTFGLAVLVAIYSLVTPKIYRAETRLLPPKSAEVGASALLDMATGGAASALAGKTPGDLYVGIAKGRTVMDAVIGKFKLGEVYEIDNPDRIRAALSANLEAKSDLKTGIISIAVLDKDPARAAAVANGFVEALKDVTSGLAISESAQKRLYYESQIKDVQASLQKAENDLKAYQERTGIQEAGSQTGALIGTLASLRAQVTAKEVQLRALRAYATGQNPEVKKVQNELAALYGALEKLEAGQGSGQDPLNPAGGMPKARLEYMRLLREAKFNEYLYGLLQKQFEMAKLGEVKDAAVIQVIDEAVPPQVRFKPKRTLMVMLAAVLGFFLSIFAAFFLEFLENASRDPESAAKLDAFKKYARITRDDFRLKFPRT